MTQAPSPRLQKLQPTLTDLSPVEQLWLLEFLIQQLRQILPTNLSNPIEIPTTPASLTEYDPELEVMAADLDIQRELATINQEFACAEMNGLEPA